MPHKLYNELAEWWPLMSAPADYLEESIFYSACLRNAGDAPAPTLLELGSGGGNNASHMKHQFEMTLAELSAGMFEVSRALNPECEHVQGDMRTIRLGRQFDRVFIHDAICYMATSNDLLLALDTAFVHGRPGGAALFAPDALRETFREETEHGGHDGDTRSLRYLSWTWDPDPADSTYTVDYAYWLRDGDAPMRVLHDRHVEGLFSRNEWMEFIQRAGFTPSVIVFDHSDLEPGSYELYLGVKPLAQ